MRRKSEGRLAKQDDKARSENEPTLLSVTIDLKCFLPIPFGEESFLYYPRELYIYNFTSYECKFPDKKYCTVWSEVNGKRGEVTRMILY